VAPAAGRRRLSHDLPHSRYAPSPENRWGGTNWTAYSNPRVDALLDRLASTIGPADRVPLTQEEVRIVIGEVAVFPLYFDMMNVLALRVVTGILAVARDGTIRGISSNGTRCSQAPSKCGWFDQGALQFTPMRMAFVPEVCGASTKATPAMRVCAPRSKFCSTHDLAAAGWAPS
jgi:hypothetical protein